MKTKLSTRIWASALSIVFSLSLMTSASAASFYDLFSPAESIAGTVTGTDNPSSGDASATGNTEAPIAQYGVSGSSGGGMMLMSSQPIDPSDMSSWTVYDHYSTGAGVAVMPSGWSTLHPNWPWYGYIANLSGVSSTFYDLSTAAGKSAVKAVENDVAPTVAQFSSHIYTEGTAENAVITFLGYDANTITDFAIYPETVTTMKSIGFDIDASKINAHTLDSFGVLINAGVSGNNLHAYALNFKMASYAGNEKKGYIELVDMSTGANLDTLHGSGIPANSATNLKGSDGHDDKNHIHEAGTIISLDSFDLNKSPVKKIRVDLEIEQNSVIVKVSYYKTNSAGDYYQYDDPSALSAKNAMVFTKSLSNTGFNGFGPFASYDGFQHTCYQLSLVKFSNMQMTRDFSVIFRTNDGTGSDGLGATHARIDDIPRNTTLAANGKAMPANPTRAGYAFKGWNTQSDGKGSWFDANYTVDKILTVYAIWEPAVAPTITITGNATNWTNKDVVLTYKVQSNDGFDLKTVGTTKDGGAPNTTSVTGKTYTNTITFTQNGNLKVDASTTYPMTATKTETVTYIDKTAPTVTHTIGKKETVNSGTFSSKVTFADKGDNGTTGSGINASTKTLYLYKSPTDTTPFKVIPYTSLSQLDNTAQVPAGKYWFAISVKDNATNYGDSTGRSTPNSTEPDGPGGKGPDDYVVVGTDTPKVIETGRTVKPASGWTNKDVDVTYEASSALDLMWVKEKGATINTITLGSVTKYTATLKYTKNGSVTVDAQNIIDEMGSGTFKVDYIDKTAPTVTHTIAKKETATASLFTSKVAFADSGDPGEAASGVDNATKTLYLYKSPTDTVPFKVIPYSSISQVDSRSDVPAGKYWFAISVKDNATNYGDSTGRSNPGSTEPDGPGGKGPDDYVVIGGDTPIVTEKSRSAVPASGYTNKDVDVVYTATSAVDLTWVKEKGGVINTITIGGKTMYEGILKFTGNGSMDVDACNIVDNVGTGHFTVSIIDKLVPTIAMPASSSTFTAADIVVTDAPANALNVKSDVDPADITVTAVEYRGTAPGTVVYTGTLADVMTKLKNGEKYDITVNALDRATNPAIPGTAKAVIFDDGDTSDDLTVTTAGDGTTATNIRFQVLSLKAAIKEIRVNGVVQYTGTSAGPKSAMLNITVTAGGTASVSATDYAGNSVTDTVRAKPVDPSATINTSGFGSASSMNQASFTAAFNGITATGTTVLKREIIKVPAGTAITAIQLMREPKPCKAVVKVLTADGKTTYVGVGGVQGATISSVTAISIN